MAPTMESTTRPHTTAIPALMAFMATALAMLAHAVAPRTASHGHAVMPTGSLRAAIHEERGDVSTQAKQLIAGSILLVFGLVIGLAFFPVISSSAEEAASDENTSSRDATLIRLLPTIVVVVLVASGLGFLFVGIKGMTTGG